MAAEKPQQKRHTIPLHVGDWLSSTTILTMSPAEEGAYFRLLCHAWSSADLGIPSDDASLAALSRLGSAWKKSAAKIRGCFVERAGRLFNLRLEAAAEIVEKTSERQRNAANSRWGKTPESEPEQQPPVSIPELGQAKTVEVQDGQWITKPGSFTEFLSAGPARWSNDEYKASQAWPSAVRNAGGAEVIISAAADYRKFCEDENRTGSHIHRPQNWLNGEEWKTPWATMERTANPERLAREKADKAEQVQAKERASRSRALAVAQNDKASPEEASQILAGVLKTFGRGGRSESDRSEKTNSAARENFAGTG